MVFACFNFMSRVACSLIDASKHYTSPLHCWQCRVQRGQFTTSGERELLSVRHIVHVFVPRLGHRCSISPRTRSLRAGA